MKSWGSCSLCHSSRWRSQVKRWSLSSSVYFPSLYIQCAAMPSSAMRCISSVRIWISKGMPDSCITVVWTDWYPLGRGMEM